MDKKCWNDTWGQIDWGYDCKTNVKKKIIELYNLSVNFSMMDRKGEKAPIHYIAELYPVDVLDLLMINGALSAFRAKDGLTPLHYAVMGDKIDNVKYLLQYGVSGIEVLKDRWGRTALELAAQKGKTDIVKILCDFNPKLVNVANDRGWTALHFAAFYKHEEMVKYLIEKGADIEAKCSNGKNALNYAYSNDWHEGNVIKLLINSGADTSKEPRLLDWAIAKNDEEMVKKLIELGADVKAEDRDGRTALDKAYSSEVITLIENAKDIRKNYLRRQRRIIAKHNNKVKPDTSKQHQ